MSTPSGNCDGGYFCPEGSRNSRGATIDFNSHVCPSGSFCPAGSSSPVACPPGTFNPDKNKNKISECLDCPSGSYCENYNMSAPSGLCSAGYYCVSGSSVSTPKGILVDSVSGRSFGGNICPVGSFCPEGSSIPQPCLPGTYNNLVRQIQCFDCPKGYFCPSNTSDYESGDFDCPLGHYCPEQTKYSTQFPCPTGTFNNVSKRTSKDDCLAAGPGKYSFGTGNVHETGACDAGFYCPKGASTNRPSCVDSYCETGGPCAPGQECSIGTAVASLCTGGFYCQSTSGLKTGEVAAGHYCRKVILICEFISYKVLLKFACFRVAHLHSQ